MVTVSALLGPAEAWLITLIALCSIVVGSGLLFWQHRVARRAQATDRPPAAGFAAVALELDSEAAAVLRLMRALCGRSGEIFRLLGAGRQAPAEPGHPRRDRQL